MTTGVEKAILAAMAKLTAIPKDRKNQQQGYSFRGIDDVYAALQPVLIEVGLTIKPFVQTMATTEHETKSGGVSFRTELLVEYKFTASSDGSTDTVRVVGEGMDSGDKGGNKAMSSAYKNMAFQVFAIPTGDKENDSENKDHDLAAGGRKASQPVTPKRDEPKPQAPACPQCQNPESTHKSKQGTGFYCNPRFGGCGASFDLSSAPQQVGDQLLSEEEIPF